MLIAKQILVAWKTVHWIPTLQHPLSACLDTLDRHARSLDIRLELVDVAYYTSGQNLGARS